MTKAVQKIKSFLQGRIDALTPIEARSSIARGKLEELRGALEEVRRVEAQAVENLEPI